MRPATPMLAGVATLLAVSPAKAQDVVRGVGDQVRLTDTGAEDKLRIGSLDIGTDLTLYVDLEEGDVGAVVRGPREGRAFGVGLSLGAGSMSVGGGSSTAFVAGIVGRFSLDSANRYQLIAEWNPMKVESPIIDEAFTSLNLLAGRSFGKTFKVRPAVGVQYRSWSGSQQVEASDWGLLLGLDLGPELRLGETVSLSPELVLRFSSIELEGNVRSRLIGLQGVVSWRAAPF